MNKQKKYQFNILLICSSFFLTFLLITSGGCASRSASQDIIQTNESDVIDNDSSVLEDGNTEDSIMLGDQTSESDSFDIDLSSWQIIIEAIVENPSLYQEEGYYIPLDIKPDPIPDSYWDDHITALIDRQVSKAAPVHQMKSYWDDQIPDPLDNLPKTPHNEMEADEPVLLHPPVESEESPDPIPDYYWEDQVTALLDNLTTLPQDDFKSDDPIDWQRMDEPEESPDPIPEHYWDHQITALLDNLVIPSEEDLIEDPSDWQEMEEVDESPDPIPDNYWEDQTAAFLDNPPPPPEDIELDGPSERQGMDERETSPNPVSDYYEDEQITLQDNIEAQEPTDVEEAEEEDDSQNRLHESLDHIPDDVLEDQIHSTASQNDTANDAQINTTPKSNLSFWNEIITENSRKPLENSKTSKHKDNAVRLPVKKPDESIRMIPF